VEGLDLHLGVDKAAGFVGRALETALREAIRSGRLHAGARLPGSRSLAADLGISRGTVVQAYTQLITAGFTPGLALLARVLRRLGARTVATEDPGLARHRDVLHAAGLATVPLDLGSSGNRLLTVQGVAARVGAGRLERVRAQGAELDTRVAVVAGGVRGALS